MHFKRQRINGPTLRAAAADARSSRSKFGKQGVIQQCTVTLHDFPMVHPVHLKGQDMLLKQEDFDIDSQLWLEAEGG